MASPTIYSDFAQRVQIQLVNGDGTAYDASTASSIVWFLAVNEKALTSEAAVNSGLGASDWANGILVIDVDFSAVTDIDCYVKANTVLKFKIIGASSSQGISVPIDLENWKE